MKIRILVRVFARAKGHKNALIVLRKVKHRIDFVDWVERCDPYHKGGFVLEIEGTVDGWAWKEAPYKLLILCQRLGRGWQITGDIEEEFDVWSNESNIPGAESIHVQSSRVRRGNRNLSPTGDDCAIKTANKHLQRI